MGTGFRRVRQSNEPREKTYADTKKSETKLQKNQLGPPCKLFEYLSCRVPIVANDVGGWSKMIEKEKIGVLTEDDPGISPNLSMCFSLTIRYGSRCTETQSDQE